MITPPRSFPRVQPIVEKVEFPEIDESLRLNPWGWYPGFGFYRHSLPDERAHPNVRRRSGREATEKMLYPGVAFELGRGQGMRKFVWSPRVGHPGDYLLKIAINANLGSLEDAAYLGYLKSLTPQLASNSESACHREFAEAISDLSTQYLNQPLPCLSAIVAEKRQELEIHLPVIDYRNGRALNKTNQTTWTCYGRPTDETHSECAEVWMGVTLGHLQLSRRKLFFKDLFSVFELMSMHPEGPSVPSV